MKKIYKTIIIGLAVLTAATPVITATTVKANTNNSAITQSGYGKGAQAFDQQELRLSHLHASGNFVPAQLITLDKVQADVSDRSFGASDDQKLQIANDLKAYLDKDVVDYSGTISYPTTNVNNQLDFVEHLNTNVYNSTVYSFKKLDQPEMKSYSEKGFTIIDKDGNPNNGQLSMSINEFGQITVESKYLIYIGGFPNIRAVRIGEVAKPSMNEWTAQDNTVYTKNHISYLHTLEGKAILDRALGGNTAWYSDRYATINGEKMYRVSTNEWVRAADII
ncbi:hypothetical protein [Companilactobacillus kimchiensis]|uniref:Surface layer protein A domain-containing protein n=1 Tax=Companilactobacillus kimchiensis TaxID=993692 RepID=A0A0R2LI34_9LACO|nr:hypothetical protein [Companilactobacillus kimchiensis]KRN97748.1 hypothetical protein IV57_GL001590 [Companilactobacillus kimchiensis]